MNDGSSDITTTTISQPWYRRRKTLRTLIIVGTAIVLLGVVFSYAPRYIARHVIAAELDELGIEHEGIDTLRINPWRLEAWIGPIRFRQAQAQYGSVGEFGVKIRLGELFNRHALIERLLVRGMDLHVSRAEDGSLFLNGIPLQQFITEAQPADAAPTEEEGWGAGLDGFEMRESRLIFDPETRGVLAVEIDRFVMDGFRTWSPEQPGRFELDARVNDIATSWTGEARPFADNITLTAKSRIDGADLPKIIEFTGPIGLDRRGGTYNTRLDHDVTLFDSGRLEGKSKGTVEAIGVDYASQDFATSIEHADLQVDTQYRLSETGDVAIKGLVVVDTEAAVAQVGDEMKVGLVSASISLADLDAELGADRSVRVSARPVIEVTDGSFTGRLQISVNQILELLTYLQSLSAGESAAGGTGLDDWSKGGVILPSSDVAIKQVSSSMGKLELTSAQGDVSLNLAADTELAGIEIKSGERTITTRALRSVLDDLVLRSGQGNLSLSLSGTNSLSEGNSRSPIGELAFSSVSAAIGEFQIESREGLLALEGRSTAEASGIRGVAYAEEQLPETGFEFGAVTAALAAGAAEVTAESATWAATGSADVRDLNTSVAKGQKAAVKIKRLQVTDASADQTLAFSADSAIIAGLDVFVTRGLLESFKKSPKGESQENAPQSQRDLVLEAQRLLTELGFEPGPADGVPGRRTTTAVRAFQEQQGLTIDGEVTAQLVDDLRAVAVGGTPDHESPVELPKVQLNRFALVDGATVRFLDDLTDPQVKIDTFFEKAEVRELDMGDPKQRTEVDIAATVNEFSRVQLNGWASALGTQPNLDVTASVTDLSLPSFSPYAVDLAGMHLRSGQLTTTTSAAAQGGALDGLIELDMLNIEFEPLSEADAERLAGQTGGIPIDTVVALLQDAEGRIELALPLQGTVAEPDVDISSAITKAVGGAFKSVFRAFKGKGDAGVGFEPIVFLAGSAELTAEGRSYAKGLVELLEERPKLSLNICGRATAQDVQAAGAAAQVAEQKADSTTPKSPATTAPAEPATDQIRQQMTELAAERTRAVRRYLINERGIDAGRVPECRASFAPEDQGPPRAEVSL